MNTFEITIPALYSRLGGQLLFSETLDRPLTPKEITAGLSRLEDLLQERAPILRPVYRKQADILRATLDTAPTALSQDARDERENALTDIHTLCNETLDLSFNALALGQNPPEYDSRPPFRGLYHQGEALPTFDLSLMEEPSVWVWDFLIKNRPA